MNKGIIIIGLGLAVIAIVLVGSQYLSDSDSSDEGYKPGDEVYVRFPSTGTAYIPTLVGEPTYVRYFLKDPLGDTIYVEEHEITYKKDELIGWSVYDEHQITIGAFPREGVWKLEGEFHATVGIIDVGSIIPLTIEFYVVEGSIIDNIMAPIYLHGENPLSFIFGTVDIALPALIYPIVVIMFIIVLLVINNRMRDARMVRLVKKHSK